MTLVALAEDLATEAVVAALAPLIPESWTVHVEATAAGTFAVAGSEAGRARSWRVVGMPVETPWGVPGLLRAPDVVAADFARYGPAAVQMVSGPFVAADTDTGTVVAGMNGIVPMYVSGPGSRWVASTSAEAVAALTGGPGAPLPPGTSIDAGRSTRSWAADLPSVAAAPIPWRWIDDEVEGRIAALGPRQPADVEIFRPRLAPLARDQRRALQRYAELRADLPRRWWRARLEKRRLCAPAFERPVLDVIRMLVEPARS